MRLKEIALCFALCSALCFAVLLSLGAVAHAQNGAFSQASASASSGVVLPSGEYDASALETGASYQSSMSFYSEFYSTTGTPIVGGIVSNPSSIDLVGRTPTSVYLAPGRVVSYAQYSSSTAATRSGELWISGSTDWSRYVACPVGTWLQLVAYSPASGAADFYEIIGNTQLQYTQYRFSSGYNTMSYQADQVGRHVLLFVSSNQSSNAIIVDVFAASSQPSSQPASQPSSQPSSQPPYTQTTQVQTPTQTQTQVPTQIPTQIPIRPKFRHQPQ